MKAPVSVATLVALCVATPLHAQVTTHPEEQALKPKVDAAISQGVESLLDRQLRDGSWGVHGDYFGGRAGLCIYTLLKCGVPMDHPAMQRAFAYLDNQDPQKTYSVACMMLAYGATGDEKYHDRMADLLARMLKWQKAGGDWAYPGGTVDLSNTQYAALGLAAARKIGLDVPPKAWQDLIDGTLAYRETPHGASIAPPEGSPAKPEKIEVAGFGYRRLQDLTPSQKKSGKHEHRGTGSMTAAGVTVLKLCEIGLGKRLDKKRRKLITRAIETGVNWLDANFTVKKNPGMNGRHLYYLYGVERVGSLTRQEQFGRNWWYVEGAKHLIGAQKDGAWGSEVHTCFALLFLRRATASGPTTGGGRSQVTRTAFEAEGEGDGIALRGAGQQPLAIYINGFSDDVLEEHLEHGLRILRVDYFDGEHKIGELAGDPTLRWTGDTFVHRCDALARGVHTIRAKVIAIDPDETLGDTPTTVTLESGPMKVVIRDVVEPWMKTIATMHVGNLIRNAAKVTYSSTSLTRPDAKRQEEDRKKERKNVTDGKNDSVWLCAPDDPEPTVTLAFSKTVKARRLVLTQAHVRDADREKVGVIRRVEMTWKGSSRKLKIDLHDDPLAPTEFVFPRLIRMKEMTLRVVARTGAPKLPVGFAEIVLLPKAPRRK